MIGIMRLLDSQELDWERIQMQDANQILGELSKKVKIYHKGMIKKLNEETKKVKELEIIIINLEAQIKNL